MASKRPPKGPQNGPNGPFWPVLAQKDLAIFRPPGAKKSKKNFVQNHHSGPPRGSGSVKNKKLALWSPPTTPFWAILCVFWPIWGPKNAIFSNHCCVLCVLASLSLHFPCSSALFFGKAASLSLTTWGAGSTFGEWVCLWLDTPSGLSDRNTPPPPSLCRSCLCFYECAYPQKKGCL